MISDFVKLLIIFTISIIFMFLVLLFFNKWKKIRKDKLQIFHFSDDYIDEEIKSDIDPTFNKKAFVEISSLRKPKKIGSSKKYHVKNYKSLLDKSQDSSFFGWFEFIRNLDDSDLYNLVNAEGFMYLYFLKSTGFFLLLLTVFSVFILIPLYKNGDNIEKLNGLISEKMRNLTNNSTYNTSQYEDNSSNVSYIHYDYLLSLTILNVYESDNKIYLILIFSYVVTFLAFLHVYNYKRKLDLLTKSDVNKDNIDSEMSKHTIHIRGLNKKLSFKEAQRLLLDFFNLTFQNYDIISVQVIPSYDKIIDLIDKKFQLESQLNILQRLNYNKPYILKSKKFHGDFLVDEEKYTFEEIKILDKVIDFYRRLIARKNTGNAFISFKNQEDCLAIIKNKEEVTSKKDTLHGALLNVNNWRINKAPTPSDIIWQNIKYSKKARIIKMIFITFILFYTCLFVITPKFLFNLISPFISSFSESVPTFFSSLISEYSYPLVIVTMNSGILPLVVYYLSIYEKHYKRSYREKSILIKTFIFLLINAIFLPSIKEERFVFMFNKLKEFDFEMRNYIITTPLLKNSYFFCRYIIQVTFISNSIQFLAVPTFLMRKIRIYLSKSDYEKVYSSLIKKYFDYGYNYSFGLIVFLMTLIFSTTIPLVVPFGCLFFYVKYYFDKYNLLFFYPAEFESEGNLGDIVIKFMLFAIFLFQIVLSGLFYSLKGMDDDSKSYVVFFYFIFAFFIYYLSKKAIYVEIDSTSSKFFEFLLKLKQSKREESLKKVVSFREERKFYEMKDFSDGNKDKDKDNENSNDYTDRKEDFYMQNTKNDNENNQIHIKQDDLYRKINFPSRDYKLEDFLVGKNLNMRRDFQEKNKETSSKIENSTSRNETISSIDNNFDENNSRFFKFLKEAYLHPTQKKLLDNPIFVYNDSFRYLKNVNEDNEDSDTTYSDYSSLIRKIKKRDTNKIFDEEDDKNKELIDEMLEL